MVYESYNALEMQSKLIWKMADVPSGSTTDIKGIDV